MTQPTAQQVTNQSGNITQDDTPTVLVQLDMPPGAAGFFEVKVAARNPYTNDAKAWWSVYYAKSDASGVVSVINPNTTIAEKNDDPATASWAYSVTANGPTIEIVVTGASATIIEWFGMFDGWLAYGSPSG